MVKLVFSGNANSHEMANAKDYSMEEFLEKINKSKVAYEVFNYDTELPLYMDYDCKNPSTDSEDTFKERLQNIMEYIKYETKLDALKIGICGYENKDKFSRHVVFNNVFMKPREQKILWKNVNKKFPEVDISPYGRTQKFRCPLSKKTGSIKNDNILLPIVGDVEDCLITHPKQSYIHWALPSDLLPEEKNEIPKSNKSPIKIKNMDKLKALISMIDPKYASEYQSWLKGGASIYNEYGDDGFCLFKQFSRLAEEYNDVFEDELHDTYINKCSKLNEITFGTMRHYAKQSNPEAYDSLFPKPQPDCMKYTALDWSEYLYDRLGQTVFYDGKYWFVCQDDVWNRQVNATSVFTKKMSELIGENLKRCATIEDSKLRDYNIRELSRIRKNIDTSGFTSQLKQHTIVKFLDNERKKQLYRQLNHFTFKNGIVDMANKQLRDIRPDDMVLKQNIIPYNFNPNIDFEKMNFINERLYEIYNCDNQLVSFIKRLLGYIFSGCRSENIFLGLIGHRAGNGKTTFMEYLARILPNYVMKLPREVLENGNSKRHKFLADIWGKRLIYVEELPKKKKLDVEFLKSLSGDGEIQNEIMFSTKEDIEVIATLVMNSNYDPNFETDGGVARRYKQIETKNKFYPKQIYEQLQNKSKSDFKVLDGLKDKLDEAKNEMYHIILEGYADYLQNGLNIPQCVLDWSDETCEENDTFNQFFVENFILDTEGRVSKGEIEQILKMNNINMTAKELKDELKKRGCEYNRNTTKSINGVKIRGIYHGLRLANDTNEAIDFIEE